MSQPSSTPSAPQYTHSLRLTFAYSGDDVRLVGVRRVAMRAPGHIEPPPDTVRSGFWLEVRDEQDNLLYHRPLHDPVRADIEVFGETDDEPMIRVPATSREGRFEVIVPDYAQASHLSLYGGAREALAGDASRERLREAFPAMRRRDINLPGNEEGRS